MRCFGFINKDRIKPKPRIVPYFCDLLIILIKGLAIFSVEEGGDSDDFFLFVDNRKCEDVLDFPPTLVHRFFLPDTTTRLCHIQGAIEAERERSGSPER